MDEEEVIRQAMSLIGRRTSERKKKTSAANGAKNVFTEEKREKLRLAQQARRERERQEPEAQGTSPISQNAPQSQQ